MENTFIDKLAWIYLVDGKVLSTRSKGKDTYYIPGGKREGAESDEEALTREIKEELSVDLIPESIKSFAIFEAQAHGKPEGTIVRMTCYQAEFDGTITPDSEIEEIIWFSYSEGYNVSSPVDQLIFDYLLTNNLIAK